jgi:hypothetical protein
MPPRQLCKAGLRVGCEGGRTYLIPADLRAFLTRKDHETDRQQMQKERG